MPGSLRIGKIFGIDIYIHISWVIILVLLTWSLAVGWFPVLGAILWYLGLANILLGIFNLIPGFPLDGGRVLRSIVWKIDGNLRRATRIVTVVGQIIAYLFILVGIWLFFVGYFIDGLWLGFIGWFLLSSAQSANSEVMLQSVFRGVTVSEVMNTAPTTVPA